MTKMALLHGACSHPKMRDELQCPVTLICVSSSCSHPKMRDELQLREIWSAPALDL